jgi:hypothetical protein
VKYFVIFILLFVGCASKPKPKPMLESGACYSMSLYSTVHESDPYSASSVHELSQIKIVGVFEWEGSEHYAVQVLKTVWENNKSNTVPLYEKTKTYGYARVEEFDKYISPNLEKWSHAAPEKKSVKCLEVTDKDMEESRLSPRAPIKRVGKDFDGK